MNTTPSPARTLSCADGASALYSLRNVSKRFGEREVLRIDSLEIEAGDIYALLGSNGAGKSTLMRILAFLDAPSGGELLYKGQKVLPGQLARFRPGVVWVPQFPVMFTGSLLYNVEYPLALQNVPGGKRRKMAMEFLEQVKLAHLAKAPAHRLSGGESQRASIARALAAGAETILFDEPTANVDQRSQGDFISLVRDIRECRSLTIMITTHNPDLAASLCRRQIFLSDGRVVKKHLLPGGEAWPGSLQTDVDGALLLVPQAALNSVLANEREQEETASQLRASCTKEAPGALPGTAPGDSLEGASAIVSGISQAAAGISLRIELAPGRWLDLLLEDENSLAASRALNLGSRLAIKIIP
ncbi:ATP-binding cassette domain-containing protein [Desulfovibrio sp. OttesenSCG-928-C06]|nr:ATP-binding cassette domain-containing protein [Desulfovibrio sp. OttesenSCG-928-C06]